MYLSKIKLWNFRKFGTLGDIDLKHPSLDLSAFYQNRRKK